MKVVANWTKIHVTPQLFEAQAIQAFLSANQVEAILLNKQDSMYKFGEIEIYVKEQDAVAAVQLLNSYNE